MPKRPEDIAKENGEDLLATPIDDFCDLEEPWTDELFGLEEANEFFDQIKRENQLKETSVTVRDIINDERYLINMSARPVFYAGNPPAKEYCGPKHLIRLAYGIYDNFGKPAANAFVEMILALDDLSPSKILAATYKLEDNGWENPEVRVHTTEQLGDVLDNHEENRAALEAVTCFLALSYELDSDKRIRSDLIRATFLTDLAKRLGFADPRQFRHASMDGALDREKTRAAFRRACRGKGLDYTQLAPKPGELPTW